jgi:2-dehydro-3-deoxygluconokinase
MIELRPEADGRLRRSFAGDAYNTAVYLKRSAPSLDVAFLTVTGDDSLSRTMRVAWRDESVSDRLAFAIPGTRPALYLIETDAKGDRRFHYWRGESPARQWLRQLVQNGGAAALDEADLIYVSGISLAILSELDRKEAITLLGTLKTKIAFDPNVRLALWPSTEAARVAFEQMAAIAAILLPSRQDLEMLYGIADAKAQIARVATLGAAEIALTSDESGCLVRGESGIVALPAESMVKIVDTSGAGDSFNGAYLAARLTGKPPVEAARDGLRLAARVIACPGAIIPQDAGHG